MDFLKAELDLLVSRFVRCKLSKKGFLIFRPTFKAVIFFPLVFVILPMA